MRYNFFIPHSEDPNTRISWIDLYAYTTGLDSRWQMFITMFHFRSWYKIEAKFANDPIKKLFNLPIQQNDRSFIERNFYDFREVKFFVNIYQIPFELDRYGKYLCRTPTFEKIESVSFTFFTQRILDRETAAAKGRYLEPAASYKLLGEIKC